MPNGTLREQQTLNKVKQELNRDRLIDNENPKVAINKKLSPSFGDIDNE
ncbi:hypothetical protein [Nodularia sp. UHCC 0506]|nr:hypothetical protein [Nodularia sp. UHCC 0506]MEA5513231.1 hypothetical protein [Nodularia sp. UHCC 0506]